MLTENQVNVFLKEHAVLSDLHPVSASLISQNAINVVRTLKAAGFQAYIVGGAIRDIYLGVEPKDFDVATNATPEQVKGIFGRRARIIGRRFKIVHVVYAFGTSKEEIIEVTTFRGGDEAVSSESQPARSSTRVVSERTGMLVRDNSFGTIAEDVDRRDFSINALYYDPVSDIVYDFHNGIEDIKTQRIDIIGDPGTRYHEDPVRMLRAIRFSAKLEMMITPRTADPIYTMGKLLEDVSNARMYDEMGKMLLMGYARRTFEMMISFNLIRYLFPALDSLLVDKNASAMTKRFLNLVFDGTDLRMRNNRKPNAKFLFACLLWPVLVAELKDKVDLASGFVDSLNSTRIRKITMAMDSVLEKQGAYTRYPNFIMEDIKNIWRFVINMQRRDLPEVKINSLITNANLKACYDFLQYRSGANFNMVPVYEHWVGLLEQHNIRFETNLSSDARKMQPVRKPRKPRNRMVLNKES
jgi:poly(A) polymerase